MKKTRKIQLSKITICKLDNEGLKSIYGGTFGDGCGPLTKNDGQVCQDQDSFGPHCQ